MHLNGSFKDTSERELRVVLGNADMLPEIDLGYVFWFELSLRAVGNCGKIPRLTARISALCSVLPQLTLDVHHEYSCKNKRLTRKVYQVVLIRNFYG